MVQDNIIWKNDSETCGIIEFVEIKDSEKENKIEIRGKLANKFLKDRIVYNKTDIVNTELGLRKIVIDNCINRNPIDNFKITNTINNWTDLGNKVANQVEVAEVFEDYENIGFITKFLVNDKTFEFNMYKGTDVSETVVFSDEFENIFDTIINLDKSNYKNVAYVYGEGEGDARKNVTVDISNGEHERELFVDARDIQQTKQEVDSDGNITKPAMTDQEYKDLLTKRGYEKLFELLETKVFKTNIVPEGMYKYKVDYKLGDLVTCRSDKYKLKFKVRITAIQESYSISGYEIIATLGYLNKEDYYG